MGKFSGMLLVSDYDNTLCYTETALREGTAHPPIHPKNLAAIDSWIEEGGKFAIATGRALAAFLPHVKEFSTNAPAIVDNGAAIYDLEAGRFLVKQFLPDIARDHLADVMVQFPEVSLEMYHEGDLVQVFHPTAWNRKHARLTRMSFQAVDRLDAQTVPTPLAKALFIAEKPVLDALLACMVRSGYAAYYELIFSSDHLLEMTAKGADKGSMALRLKDLCGCSRLFCIGDHANDLPMLQAADQGFAPANAIDAVRSSGVRMLCHCLEGAVAQAIDWIGIHSFS